MLELLLIGGYDSLLHAGDKRALREQLWRTRHRLPLRIVAERPQRATEGSS